MLSEENRLTILSTYDSMDIQDISHVLVSRSRVKCVPRNCDKILAIQFDIRRYVLLDQFFLVCRKHHLLLPCGDNGV